MNETHEDTPQEEQREAAPFARGEEQDVFALTGEDADAPEDDGREPDPMDEEEQAAYEEMVNDEPLA